MKRYPFRIAITLTLLVAAYGLVTIAEKRAMPAEPLLASTSIEDALHNLDLPASQKVAAASDSKLVPGPDDTKIALVTASILAQSHYLRHPLDEAFSSKLLDEYMDALDPRHNYFLQSDVQEFAVWRNQFGTLLLKKGDTSPADKIFARFLERFDQQVTYVNDLLKTEKFTFDGSDTYSLDRKNAPRPKDLDEAKHLWHDYLRYEYLQEKLNKQKPEDIVKTLARRYARIGRALHEYDDGDVLEIFLTSLAHVYDPHSDYLGKSSLDNFNMQMKLSLFGIGALLTSEDGYCKIEELTPGGPAIKSGLLKPSDRIVAVAQGDQEPVDVVDMKLDKVVAMIRGPKGTKVRLTIIPADATDPSVRKQITLVRDEVKLQDREAKAELVEMPGANGKSLRMGVINLPSFYADTDANDGNPKSTTSDVSRLLKKLMAEHVDGVVLDLRGNPGGSLAEAIKLTGLFIKSGPVVQVKSFNGALQVDEDNDSNQLYSGPLVVLTNKGSASASEIVAGALQDYGRALIVGDSSTFGKGTVQTVISLGQIMQRNNINVATDPGALKLTIQKFYRASGESTQLKGVVPDITLPSLTNYLNIGEKTEDNPMPWDTVQSASFQKLNLVQPFLAQLKQRSDARIATDPDFAFLQQQIEQYKKLLADKTVSLNEQARLKEKQESEARAKKRREDLKVRPLPTMTVYELTLADTDKPGLPPPVDPKAKKKDVQSKSPKQDPTAVSPTGPSSANDDDVPSIDITLNETERILADLIALSGKS